MWHDIWYEPEIEEIIKETIQWIHRRLKQESDKDRTGMNPEQIS